MYITALFKGVGKLDKAIASVATTVVSIEESLAKISLSSEDRGSPETSEKTLFLSFTQNWCESKNDTYLKEDLKDTHPSGKQHILRAMMNNKDFANIFNCSNSAPMNSSKKCTLW